MLDINRPFTKLFAFDSGGMPDKRRAIIIEDYAVED